MPADFHARWTSAVASEAGNCTQSGVPAGPQAEGIQAAASEAGSDAQGEAPARIWSEKAQMSVLHGAENDVSAGFQSDETQPAATAERKPAGKIRRLPAAWSRLIGVAAVMVFLVGGTLLTRDSFHAKMSQPVMASDAGGAVLQSAHVEESAANLTEADSDRAEFVTTDAEQLDEAAYKEAALDSVPSDTEEIEDGEVAFEETEGAALAGSSADADAGVPAAGLMISSLQADAPEAEAISETAALTETEADEADIYEIAEADTYEIAEAVSEESSDAAMSEENAEQPALVSETAAEKATEQIEPDPHPVRTFLRDMGFFIRWIAPWALVLAVGVFAGWLVGRRR